MFYIPPYIIYFFYLLFMLLLRLSLYLDTDKLVPSIFITSSKQYMNSKSVPNYVHTLVKLVGNPCFYPIQLEYFTGLYDRFLESKIL